MNSDRYAPIELEAGATLFGARVVQVEARETQA